MKSEDAINLANRVNLLHTIRGHKMNVVDYCTFIEWLITRDEEFKSPVDAYKQFTCGKASERIYRWHAPQHIYDEYVNRSSNNENDNSDYSMAVEAGIVC